MVSVNEAAGVADVDVPGCDRGAAPEELRSIGALASRLVDVGSADTTAVGSVAEQAANCAATATDTSTRPDIDMHGSSERRIVVGAALSGRAWSVRRNRGRVRSMSGTDHILTDLACEYQRLDAILGGLTGPQWLAPSGAPGWTVRDVVVHLAVSEEGVGRTLQAPSNEWRVRDRPLDESMDEEVQADGADPPVVLARWRAATSASLSALASADPDVSVRWAAAPLRPLTLATTRLAEHWAHALDICDPLGIELPDTNRLRHIAWLGHATLPYAFRLSGIDPFPVRCQLEAPDGETWTFGPERAEARVSGSVGMFCRVGARRVSGSDSGLVVSNVDAATALGVLRNYAV